MCFDMRTKREYVLILWQGLNVSFYFYALSWKHNRIFLTGHPLKTEKVVCFLYKPFRCLATCTCTKVLFWFTYSSLKHMLKVARNGLSKPSLAMDSERIRSGEVYTLACFGQLVKSIMSSLFFVLIQIF